MYLDRILTSLLRSLKSPKSLRIIVYACLFGSRYHKSAAAAYREFVERLDLPNADKNDQLPVLDSIEPDVKAIDNGGPETKMNESKVTHGNEVFPLNLHWSLRWFMFLDSCICVSGLLRQFLPWEMVFKYFGFNKPSHCYLAGQFVQIDPYRGNLSTVFFWNFCLWHVNWCTWQYLRIRPIPNLMAFVYQKPSDLEKAQKLYETSGPQPEVVFAKDALLRYIMTYPRRSIIDGKTQFSYTLRPNRTLKSYEEMATNLAKMALTTIVFYILLITSITSCVLIVIFSDLGYSSAYPGCDVQLDHFYLQMGDTFFTFHPTISWQRLYVLLMDLLINFVVYIEVYLNVMFVAPAATIFNMDIRIYWRHTQERISKLLDRIRIECPLVDQLESHASDEKNHFSNVYYKRNNRQRGGRRFSSVLPELGSDRKNSCFEGDRHGELDEEICALQAEINDFFEQFEVADAYVRDILSSGIFAWLVSCAAVRFGASNYQDDKGDTIGIKIFHVFGACLYTLIGGSLWDIKRQMDKSYLQICSLAAQCKLEHKRELMKVAEHFLNRSGFTLIGGYPFTLGTYLTIINWTITALSIVDNLF